MIKIVCAWCGKVIREGTPGIKQVSHLICPECFKEEKRRLQAAAECFGEEMRQFEAEARGKNTPPPRSPRFCKPPEP